MTEELLHSRVRSRSGHRLSIDLGDFSTVFSASSCVRESAQ